MATRRAVGPAVSDRAGTGARDHQADAVQLRQKAHEAEQRERARIERFDKRLRALVEAQESGESVDPWGLTDAVAVLAVEVGALRSEIATIRREIRQPLTITRPRPVG